jgi:hypothetical protein
MVGVVYNLKPVFNTIDTFGKKWLGERTSKRNKPDGVKKEKKNRIVSRQEKATTPSCAEQLI